MYTLYYLPDACSLATQVVLHELGQPVTIINKQSIENFERINPLGTVPVLLDQERVLTEGAAIMLHLLSKHPNNMLPAEGKARVLAIQNMMFANATMHPAYGRLFFIAQSIADEDARQQAFARAAEAINRLWQVVETRLSGQAFLGGAHPSAADIMLAVYSRWAGQFPVEVRIGPNAMAMINAVISMPSFQRALLSEQAQQAA